MSSRAKLVAGATAALAGTTALVWWATTPLTPSHNHETATQSAVTKRQAAPGTSAGADDVPARIAPEHTPTLRGRYALRYEIEMAGVGAAGAETRAQMSLTGTLEASPAERIDADGARTRWVTLALKNAEVTLNESMRGLTDLPDDVKTHLAAPFVVTLEENGRVVDIRFQQGQSAASRGVFAALAQAAQVVAEAGGATADTEYEAPAWSINGPLGARWTRTSGAKGEQMVLQWARSEELETSGGGVHHEPVSSGRSTMTLKAGDIDAVEATERGRALGGGQNAPSYTAHMSLQRQQAHTSLAATALTPEQLEPFDPHTVSAHVPADPQVPFDEAMQQVTAAAGGSWQVRGAARGALVAALMAEPERASEVVGAFRKARSSHARRTMAESLAAAGHAPAQTAISVLLTDTDLALDERTMVAGTLIGIAAPNESLLESLSEVAFHHVDKVYASRVAMTMGATLHLVSSEDPELAIAHLGPYLDRAKNILQPPADGAPPRYEERANWLGGLGNLASPNALSLIDANLDDPAMEIRSAAAHALRFQDAFTVRERMQQVMHEEESLEVRLGILHSARYLGPATQQTLVERSLHYGKYEGERMEAAYVIANWMDAAPGLRQVLAYALEQEQSDKVRDTLRNFLEPGRAAPPAQIIRSYNDLIPEAAQEANPDAVQAEQEAEAP